MVQVKRVSLPGVGVMHSFLTDGGSKVGVITHRSGVSDLVVIADPEARHCEKMTVRLDDDEARTAAELLGGTEVTESIESLSNIPGLSIDWLQIDHDDAIVGNQLGSFEEQGIFGVTIVAVVRGGEAVPAPRPESLIRSGDTLIVAGTPEKVRKCFDYFRTGHLAISPSTGPMRLPPTEG